MNYFMLSYFKGCLGGNPKKAFNYAVWKGIEMERDYEYEEKDDTCRSDDDSTVSRAFIKGYIGVTADTLKASLAMIGPIATGNVLLMFLTLQ